MGQLLSDVEGHLTEVCGGENHLKPYQFKMDELDGFRYRARDAWRSVTKIAIREARLKELKLEMLNSQKLKAYFEDNPRDKQLLKHQDHLKNVPEYIVPETLKRMTGMKSSKRRRGKKGGKGGNVSDTHKQFLKRKADPLDMGISKKKR